jgi:parallel beta-helix repeat protein
MQSWKFFAIVSLICAMFSISNAKTFYLDPSTGKLSNDGSKSAPWRTLQEVIDSNLIETREAANYPYVWGTALKTKNPGAPVKAGDTLLLMTGYHGDIRILRAYNTDYITIAAAPNQTPGIKRLRMTAVAKWIVRGLTVSPQLAPAYDNSTLIFVESHNWSGLSREVVIENCMLYSVKDASGWTMQQWDTLSCSGIAVSSNRVVIRDNILTNVNFGISVSGDSCRVERNTIRNFAGDGLRGLGDDGEFLYNYVSGCYAVNANHDDGFQSWSEGADGSVGTGVVKRVKLIGNTIINYTDAAQPFRGTLQGIGCFDGMFEEWVVENNVIVTDHWHGISLYGAKNCRIVNNTVCDLNTADPGPPWIMITNLKNGTKSSGCVVRNNLATAVFNEGDATCVADHNIILKNPADFFVDYAGLDLHLKAGAPAVDSGSGSLAPATDITGAPRPTGDGVDVGAYEFTPDGGVKRILSSKAAMPARSGLVVHKIGASAQRFGIAAKTGEVEVYTLLGECVCRFSVPGGRRVGLLPPELPAGVFFIRAVRR